MTNSRAGGHESCEGCEIGDALGPKPSVLEHETRDESCLRADVETHSRLQMPIAASRMARTPLCTQITWASLRTARSDSVGACCAHPEPAFPAGGTEAEAPGAAKM